MTCVGVICCTPVTLGQGRLTTTGTGAQVTSAARAEVMWEREHEAGAALYSAVMEELELSQVSEQREAETERSVMRTWNILTDIVMPIRFTRFNKMLLLTYKVLSQTIYLFQSLEPFNV